MVTKKSGLFPPHEKPEKKFAFLKFHVFEDHKHTFSVDSKEFFQNPVMLKTDRFLEKELRDTMQLGIKRPYTLVVDTAGCNKNCWFCYAYPIVKKKDYDLCRTISLSPEKLAACFVDKICTLKNIVRLRDRFFSKLRITGGEPLFSTEDTLTGAEGSKKPIETINYFLDFFEVLDPQIGKLVRDGVICLSTPKRYSDGVPFPTFLCSDDSRVEIRFDTNGFLFGDREFADKFVGGIHSLYKTGKLENLLIKIDYSLKGVRPLEVYWSQSEQLPVDEERLGDFRIDDHPQYAGLKNLLDLRNEYERESPGFSKCFGLTVEPGISNVKGNSLYYVGSLDWRLLERKLQQVLGASFRLSDVDNKMEVRGKIHTHLKRGAAVKLVYDGGQFVCLPTDSKSKKSELFAMIKKFRDGEAKFNIVFVPYVNWSMQDCRQQQLRL